MAIDTSQILCKDEFEDVLEHFVLIYVAMSGGKRFRINVIRTSQATTRAWRRHSCDNFERMTLQVKGRKEKRDRKSRLYLRDPARSLKVVSYLV